MKPIIVSVLAIAIAINLVSCDNNVVIKDTSQNCQFPFEVPTLNLVVDDETPANQTYDIVKAKCVTNYAHTLKTLPQAPPNEIEKFTPMTEEEIKKANLTATINAFNQMKRYFFKNIQVDLVFTQDGSGFSALYQDQKVIVGLDDLNKILQNNKLKVPLDVVKYVLAHELAHYIHEISARAPITTKPNYTYHGNVSLFSLSAAFEVQNPSAEIKELTTNFSQHYYNSHAEVDVFATTVLIKNGFSNWADVYSFFDQEIASLESDQIATKVDMQGRKIALQKTVANYNK